MNILQSIYRYGISTPQKVAFQNGRDCMTYQELDQISDRLACFLEKTCGENKSPVAVYGHKQSYMVAAFLACVKSGRGYCPIDCSVPESRVADILSCLDSPVVLAPGELEIKTDKRVISLEELKMIGKGEKDIPLSPVEGEDTFYIIFTSGSTGKPKGVQITADCLNCYLDWSMTLGNAPEEKQGLVFLNQAPFSFDLSVMDLYTCLASGGTLWCLEKEIQGDYGRLFDSLYDSHAGIWVSTPSFADICLADPRFTQDWMPELKVFLFCGETLTNRTGKKLKERFPNAVIMNTYGPTESTVAVTEVEVTKELLDTCAPLPVGKAKPGTWLEIWDSEGHKLPEGEEGEIIILGNTVSTGYYQRPDLTEKVFFTEEDGERVVRGYRTGDSGYMKDGMLFYCGRIDLQIKLHGYRIELEDIENNLRKLPGVSHAVVIPNQKGGKVKSLTAFVAAAEKERQDARQLREDLGKYLPVYMIPKKIIFMSQIPLTNNGKADRKTLGGMVS